MDNNNPLPPVIVPIDYDDFVTFYDEDFITSFQRGLKGTPRPIKNISPDRYIVAAKNFTTAFQKCVSPEETMDIMSTLRRDSSTGKRSNPELYGTKANLAMELLSSADYAYYTLAQTGLEEPEEKFYVTLDIPVGSDVIHEVIWEEEKFLSVLKQKQEMLVDVSDRPAPPL